MTREEAIRKVKAYFVNLFSPDEYVEIVEEIVEALEQEPCEDAISRQAVNEIMGYVVDYWREHAIDIEPHEIKDTVIEQFEYTAKQLNELPPVSPTRKTGKWFKSSQYSNWYCNRCNYETGMRPKFCPNCGADMRGEENG